MKQIKFFAVLVVLCFAGLACGGNIAKTHQLDVKSTETDLMKYDSAAQRVSSKGQVNTNLTLVGQPKMPSQTVTTKQVPVQVMTTSAPAGPPPRPVYGRAAKAVPRTPPVVCQPKEKTEMRQVVETTTAYSGPQVLSNSVHGGPTTGHSVAAGLAYSVPAAAGYVAGNAVAPGVNVVTTAVGKGGKGGNAKAFGGDASSSSSSAASASAAAAAAADGGGSGGHGCK